MNRSLAARGLVVLGLAAGLAMTGCTPQPQGGQPQAGSGSCASPSLRTADGQTPLVQPGDSITLIAQDFAEPQCPESDGTPIERVPVKFEVVWTQNDASAEVGSFESTGGPEELEILVPADAVAGPATISVADTVLEVQIEG